MLIIIRLFLIRILDANYLFKEHNVLLFLYFNIKSISKQARDWYSQAQNDNPRNVSVALIVNSFYTRIIANFFLGFKNSRTEMKIFNEKDDAIEWLYEQLDFNESLGNAVFIMLSQICEKIA